MAELDDAAKLNLTSLPSLAATLARLSALPVPLGPLVNGQSDDVTRAVIETYQAPDNATLRMLLACNWGPMLMNLGYFPHAGLFSPLNALASFAQAQVRLVTKAVRLLRVGPRHQVADIACGRGKSTYMLAQTHPELQQVVGIDLNPRSIEMARTAFGDTDRYRYEVGDAEHLPFDDGTIDRLISIEAAFHFPDRAKFLREAGRVLRPGGRMVVVDFVWNDAEARTHRDEELVQTVRKIWGWNDLFTGEDYQQSARAAGLQQVDAFDWSRNVTLALQGVFERAVWLSSSTLGRRYIIRRYPQLRGLTSADWTELGHSAKAHRRTCALSRYKALVFERPC